MPSFLHDGTGVVLGDVDQDLLVRLVSLAADLLDDHLRHTHGKLVSFAAHLFDQNRHLQLAAAVNEETVRRVGLLDRIARFVSASFIRRSRRLRLVTYLPSRPANGESLIRNSIESVGSSIASGFSGSGLSASAKLSPSPIPPRPATAMMSPGPTDSASTRASPSYSNSAVIPALTRFPSR
jgi:hypothetical protein